jgi:hypothetical protein
MLSVGEIYRRKNKHMQADSTLMRARVPEQAAYLAEAGKLLPWMDKWRFTLESANEAYPAVAAHTTKGRLVVEVA